MGDDGERRGKGGRVEVVLTLVVRDTAVGVACGRRRDEGSVGEVGGAGGAGGAGAELVEHCREGDQTGHAGQVQETHHAGNL